MGRNKDAEPLTKRERKLKKEGLLTTSRGTKSYMGRERACTMRRTGIDTRRPVQTSNNSTWLHAILFCVLVGMHGAAMTHLLFAKQRAVAVELFSGTLISLRKGGGLWFFARYTKGYYGKIFLDRGPRQERSTLDAVQAARTVRCASEASAGPRAKRPSCDK